VLHTGWISAKRKRQSKTGPKTPSLPKNREGSGTQFQTLGKFKDKTLGTFGSKIVG